MSKTLKHLKPNITAADHIENGLAIREVQAKRIAELEAALEKIANCEKVCDGDVVDVARKALGR